MRSACSRRSACRLGYFLIALGPHVGDQCPDLVDLDANSIARLEIAGRFHGGADASGRSREDHIARFERHGFAQMCDLVEDIEHQFSRIGILPHLAVDEATYAQRMGIADFVGRDDPGSERCVCVERLAQDPLWGGVLPIAHADIVAATETEYDLMRLLPGHVLAAFSDDE